MKKSPQDYGWSEVLLTLTALVIFGTVVTIAVKILSFFFLIIP